MNTSQLSDKEICLASVTFEFRKLVYWAEQFKKPDCNLFCFFQFYPSVPSSAFVVLFQCYLTVLSRYFYISFNLMENFYKEKDKFVFAATGPNTTFFYLQRLYLLNLG